MSHIVQIQTQVRDPVAIHAACRRLELPQPLHQTVKLFAAEVTGLAVQLPGWRYAGFVNNDTAASLTTQPGLSTTATASSHVNN